MKIIYECGYCHKQFSSKKECGRCEESHLSNVDKFKYHVLNVKNEDLCQYCKNMFLVYGCEQDCEYKDCNESNCFKDFKIGGINV